MTGQFEREVTGALEIFLAAVARAAERAAIDVIRSAFARALVETSHAVRRAAATSGDGVAPLDELAHRRAAAPRNLAAVRVRVVACIHENPGWSTAQLARSLGIDTDALRYQLRKLVREGAIRIEESAIGSRGQQRRAYFAVEHINGDSADPSFVPVEAMA